jgi:predicted esterase
VAIRVQFIHGLESSPQGTKARVLAQHFEACTKQMNTSDFLACVALQATTILEFRPDVLVGSSFGGAVAVALLERNEWKGPTLLLAQAAYKYLPNARLPKDVPIIMVHGLKDDVIDVEDSRRLARTGQPERVQLIEVDDVHDLRGFVESGQLVELVKKTARLIF